VQLASQGNSVEADEVFQRLMRSPLRSAAVDYNYAVFCRDHSKTAQAISVLREMLRIHSTHAQGLRLLAELLLVEDSSEFPMVLRRLRRVAAVDAHLLRLEAAFLSGCGDHLRAVELLQQALELGGRSVETLFNYSVVLERLGDREGASVLLEEVLELTPGHHLAAHNLAHHRLASGDFGRGWDLYESRWYSPAHRSPAMFPPDSQWDGTATQHPLLVWPEQGLGEKILFSGFIEDLLNVVETILWITDMRLVPLLRPLYPTIEFLGADSAYTGTFPSEFHQISAGSLGRLFGREVGFRRPRLAGGARRSIEGVASSGAVGISWRSTSPELGAGKSFPLATFEAFISSCAGTCKVVSLQHDLLAEECAWLQERGVLVPNGELDLRNDLVGLAGLIEGFSRVVTVSNTVAHLSGALGVQTDVLTSAGLQALWFWENPVLVKRWYPSVTVHRQSVPGDWASAFAAAGLAFQ
jgi:Flp pilus assembly protein TadD